MTPLPAAALLDVIKRVRGVAQKNAAIAGARVALLGFCLCFAPHVAPQQLTRLPPAAVARLAKEPTNGVIMQARIMLGHFSTK